MYSDNKYYLWTPLVGFDMDKEDRGVDEYFSKIKSKPAGISLFVFNADIINLHRGMDKEYAFPADYCNYYGAPRNELRSIQSWTNYKLKELIQNINKKDIETYLGIMGNHTVPKDRVFFAGNFGFLANQDFLVDNEEACIEGVPWTGHTYMLKRLKDGSFFEDYFLNATLKALDDYSANGIHISDAIFPPSMQLQNGDYSFDMINQFVAHTGTKLPDGMTEYKDGNKFNDIKNRADYIWNNLRAEWISFVAWRWNGFLTKLCNGLHAHGKKLMVNNCWMSEPFESLYRYGIDYKSLSNAGVDIVCQEQQASIICANKSTFSNITDDHYCKNMLMKAYSGKPECLTITFAKDSTEEASMITHLPSLCESEQFQLANYYIYDNGSYKRTIDGYFIDLADALTENEWDWLIKRYEKIFADERFQVIAPTLVWHDDFMGEKFLKEYVKTRRWSTHRYLAYLNRQNASIHAVCKFDDIDKINADLFIPNVDMLSKQDVDKIKAYKKGIVAVTLSKANDNLGFDGVRFEDQGVSDGDNRTVCYILNAKEDYACELEFINTVIDDSAELDLSSTIVDTSSWTYDIIFNKVSNGFLTAIAKILKKATIARHGVALEGDKDYTVIKMESGALRVIYPNKDLNHYDHTKVGVMVKVKKVINKMDFPAQPLKIVIEDGQAVADLGKKEILDRAIGFMLNVAPAGIAVADIFTE